ncbi:MAG: hypothetical protein HZA54_08500 [Planctomycetes bacterium]|nr:hypothetical protein [Planctomycetota bacterium]
MVNRMQRSSGTTFRRARKASFEKSTGDGAAATSAGAGAAPAGIEPLYGAWINEDYKTADVAIVLLARHHHPGHVHYAAFFVEDGLGVVECFGSGGCPEPSFQRLVKAPHLLGTAAPFMPCELVLAQELVLGGADLARKSGLSLPREFAAHAWIVGEMSADQELPPELFPVGEDVLTFGVLDDHGSRPLVADRMAAAGDTIDRLRQIARTSGAPFTPMFDRPGNEYGIEAGFDSRAGEFPDGNEALILTRVHFAHEDYEDALIRLKGVLELQLERSGAGKTRFAWVRPYPSGHWNASADPETRQVLGHLTVTAGEVVAEVKTRSWGEVIKRLLQAAGGQCMRYRSTEHRDPVPEILEAVRNR